MGSRVRLDPDHIFEVFLELAKPPNSKEEPYLLQIFPEQYNDAEVLKSVPKFAFPCLSDDSNNKTDEHFTFVLTDIESRFKFGFCRSSSQTQTCLCIISCLPWYEIFYHVLDNISSQLSCKLNSSVLPFLKALFTLQSFKPGESVAIANENVNFVCPVPNQLPVLPENRNLNEFCSCLDVNNMMAVFASMLYERRILVVSQSLSRLTACIPGAALLLHPMNWQHLYIPVLPPHLLDYCSAPMPFLIGLHSSVMKKTRVHELGDTVILNVDTNTVTSEYDDLSMLPDEVVSSLKRHLKQQDKMHGNQLAGDGIARAFLKAMVALIGGYRDALRFRPGEPITFDPDAFVISRPASMQPFLKKILQFQTFQQFISDRLDLLNAGEGFKDDFDQEASLYSDKWGTQSRYKDWTNHMKKQGKKLRREGKDKWFEFTAKVKDRSKKTFKDLTSRIEDIKREDASQPVRNHKSAAVYGQPHRPPRPPPPNFSRALGAPVAVPRQSTIRRQSLEKVQRYHPILDDSLAGNDLAQLKVDRISIDESELTFNPLRRINTDLMGDPDIQKAFRKSYSLEDLKAGPALVYTDDEEQSDIDGEVSWEQLSANFAVGKWSQMNSELSLDSRSSGSITGTGSIASSGDICRARPISLHRQAADVVDYGGRNGNVVKPTVDEPLITLDTSSSNSFNSLENIEFDPLKRQIQVRQTLTTDGGGSEMRLALPVPKPRLSKAKPTITPPKLPPKPDVLQSHSPAIFRRKDPSPLAFDSQSVREARAAFMQAEVMKPVIQQRLESLDQFDPLASGQLVVDMPGELASGRSAAEDEDDLLKEWNLDFDRIKHTTGGDGNVPINAAAFSSMPNLFPQPKLFYPTPSGGSGYFVGYPPPVQPQMSPLWAGGPMMGHHAPGIASPQVVGSVTGRLPISSQPPLNIMRPNSIAGTNVSARSSTLPSNSNLSPDIFSMDTGGETSLHGPQRAKVVPLPSQRSTGSYIDGRKSKHYRPISPNSMGVDLVLQNNNQWEKFE